LRLAALALAIPWLLVHCGTQQTVSAPRGALRSCTLQSIYDGDTLRAVCDGEALQIRLHCIDAPEMGQRPWGKESRDYLRRMTPDTLRLRAVEKDRYGRIVGNVLDGKTDLNLQMVAAGQATVYARYCNDRSYFAAERKAKRQRLGIWAQGGAQQRPWEWRKR
jgi:endonuclease YncB( thermonuclease family)